MASIQIETLREQLATTEQELEHARAHVYRCDGVIQLLKHLIQQAEQPITESGKEK